MASGKQVNVICNQLPSFGDTSLPRARRFAEVLLPHVRAGALTLKHARPLDDAQSETQQPSIVLFDQATGKASFLYPINRPDAVLNQLWADSMLLREVTAEEAKPFDVSSRSIQAKDLESPDTIQRFHYNSHQSRQLDKLFAFLGSNQIKRIEIIDRYMVSKESNKSALKQFLNELADLWTTPPTDIVLKHGPECNQQERPQWITAMDQIIKAFQSDPRFNGCTLRNEFRGKTRQRNFHDRRLVAKTAYVAPGTPLKRKRKAGAAVQKPRTFTVELTGGIDILMNQAEETSAFVFEETT